jgi:hypothetical protein
LAPLLPGAGFIRLRIKALVRVRCPVPVETRFSIRPFALRQRRFTLRSITTAGSTFLACIFETIPKFSSARSVSNSRPRLAFYGRCGVRSTLETRCKFPSRNSTSVFRPPLPVRISQSLRLIARSLIPSAEACLPSSTFHGPPASEEDSLRSPFPHSPGSHHDGTSRSDWDQIGWRMPTLPSSWLPRGRFDLRVTEY